ncbi:putative MFS family arabinose efflux permease [Breoghania corrubedonensis]|uniref:Putative MFS family arabinose efflux permease n=1 Tax=Breoghania corrubedonensis TaxID=665038 RepID=A0A2T5VID7_9HYPH|nr:MFS transporter [Breoghania corrubedonensis]PTW63513.1 putative MFS family arabinose efflux permease [Breoghania corrubedonensis]
MSTQDAPDQSRWLAFTHSAFRRYWAARFGSTFAVQIVSVSVGWQVYDITRNPLDLGFVGLAQFLPAFLLVLVTGTVADRFGRRTVMGTALIAEGVMAALLLAFTLSGSTTVWPIFVLLVGFGTARAFFNPASSALVTNLVPPEHLANAIAWNSSAWQVASIVGPVAGGLLYGLSPYASYAAALIMLAGAAIAALSIPRPEQHTAAGQVTFASVVDGFRYIWREKVVLGAISLDLFAVLLGGAVALLPVYARDILELGPWGLGLLRAAPGIGAIMVAMWLAAHPLRDHAGLLMFVFVGLFGAFTVLFGVSTMPWLSIAALLLMGAFDMVSVYVRETLIQLWTPDALRGRVNAVNMVFVGASNELGEFRAGVMAAAIGTVSAVVVGGMGTMAVAALWAKMFPDLRKARHLDGRV